MDLLIVLAPGMGHDKLRVITAMGDEGIDQEFSFFFLQHLCSLLKDQGVGPGMARKGSNIRLDHRYRRLVCHQNHSLLQSL